MKMKMKESKFGAPKGVYNAIFLGCKPMPTHDQQGKPILRYGRDGKLMPPGVEWQFQITSGVNGRGDDQINQIVGRITSAEPTKKNSCGVLMAGIVGREISSEEDEIDLASFEGQPYEVVVSISKDDPDKTYVTEVTRLTTGGQSRFPLPPDPRTAGAPQHTSARIQTPTTAAPKKGPPPGLGTATAAAPAFVEQPTDPFELDCGDGSLYEVTRAELQAWVNTRADDPTGFRLKCLVGPTSGQWHTVGAHGFKWSAPVTGMYKDEIPF